MDISLFSLPAGDWSARVLAGLIVPDSPLFSLLQIWSSAVLIGGALWAAYVVVHVVTDTAHSGKPMGGRHAVWLPMRFILAVGLAVPLPVGLSASVLFSSRIAAPAGAGLANTMWAAGVEKLVGDGAAIFLPPSPSIDKAARDLFLSAVCIETLNAMTTDGGFGAAYTGADAARVDGLNVVTFSGHRELGFGPATCGGFTYTAAAGGELAQHFDVAGYEKKLLDSTNVVFNALRTRYARPLSKTAYEGHGEMPSGQDLPDLLAAWQTALHQYSRATFKTEDRRDAQALLEEAKAGGWTQAGFLYFKLGQLNAAAIALATEIPRTSPPNLSRGFDDDVMMPIMERALLTADSWWSSNMERRGSPEQRSAALRAGTTGDILQQVGLSDQILKAVVLDEEEAKTNPLAALVTLGHRIIWGFWGALTTMTTVQAAAGTSESVWTKIATLGFGDAVAGAVKGAWTVLGPPVLMLLLAMLAAGVTLAYVLPLTPGIYFIIGIAKWIRAILLSAFAAPIWAMAHLKMDGDTAVPHSAHAGYSALIHVFLMPPTMIFGVFVGFTVLNVVAAYAVDGFGYAVKVATSGNYDFLTGALVGTVLMTGVLIAVAQMGMRAISEGADYVVGHLGFGRDDSAHEVDRETHAAGAYVQGGAQNVRNAAQSGGAMKKSRGGAGKLKPANARA